jgi:hypothetical protein
VTTAGTGGLVIGSRPHDLRSNRSRGWDGAELDLPNRCSHSMSLKRSLAADFSPSTALDARLSASATTEVRRSDRPKAHRPDQLRWCTTDARPSCFHCVQSAQWAGGSTNFRLLDPSRALRARGHEANLSDDRYCKCEGRAPGLAGLCSFETGGPRRQAQPASLSR